VDVSGSHSPPLDADGNWRQTGEHLSPWRGIWCGTKLNTMHGHGIPSELSGLGKQDWKPGLAVEIQGAYNACGTRFIDD
jgi:hypothetical protein